MTGIALATTVNEGGSLNGEGGSFELFKSVVFFLCDLRVFGVIKTI
jgi:hypothetical protein